MSKPKQKRILIVRPDRIGDVILSTPLPREIKKAFPESFIAMLLKRYTQDIYINNPYVDKILLIDDGSSFWQKVREIRRYRFSHSLHLLPTERINYMLFFAGIPYRVGVSRKLYQFLTFTRYVSRNKYIPLRHEADYCMDLARRIGVISDDLTPEIFLTEDEQRKVKEIRSKFLENGKKFCIGIHTSSGNSAPNWKISYYKDLILRLQKIEQVQVVVTDDKLPFELEEMKNIIFPNIGKTLREAIINFAALDLLVSSSTGPMHICAALKIKTVSMFCPLTACSPKLWGPLSNNGRIILSEEDYCNYNCHGDPKRCSFEGVGGIPVERVYQAILNELGMRD
jgi:heptosyltransferase-3